MADQPKAKRLRIEASATFDLATIVDITDDMTVADITNKAEAQLLSQFQLMIDRHTVGFDRWNIEYQEFT